MTEAKRIPWAPKEKYVGPTMQNVKIEDQMGILHTDQTGARIGEIKIPPAHYQPPLDTLRFLPEYRDGELIYILPKPGTPRK